MSEMSVAVIINPGSAGAEFIRAGEARLLVR